MGQQDKASIVQAERELKALRAENEVLRKDLEETRCLYKQLVDEGPVESLDERRVHLLKSQIIQLERQVLLQSSALNTRAGVLMLVQNSLQDIADQLRELLASDVQGHTVPVQRSQLTGLIQTTEGAKIRLYKNVEANNPENLSRPILYMGSFLKPSSEKDGVTLLDVCSGQIEHLNLKQISKLESKLFSLHRHLKCLDQSLKAVWSHDCSQHHSANQHLPLAVNQRLSGHLAQCQKSLAESCFDLLSLSILVPSAPWPLLTKPIKPELSLDSVMSALPNFPKSKQQQGKSCIDALLKACNYSRNVSKLEAKACADELQFHQSVYKLQNTYMESLFTAVREAYGEFEKNTQALLCQPLKSILDAYSALTSTTSEEALRDFLSTFKAQATDLQTVLDMLTVNGDSPSMGQEALSTYGKDFFASVDSLVEKCAAERDQLAEEIEAVKKMKEEHFKLGLDIFEKPKPGSEPRNAKEEYAEAVKENGNVDKDMENGDTCKSVFATDHEIEKNSSAVKTADKSVSRPSVKASTPKPRSFSSPGPRIARELGADKQKLGPRLTGKRVVEDTEGVSKDLGRDRSSLASLGDVSTSTPKVIGRGSVPGTPKLQGSSRLPRPGSVSHLKPPSVTGSPMSVRTPEARRHLGTPRTNILRQTPSSATSLRRTSSEESRLNKGISTRLGSQGST